MRLLQPFKSRAIRIVCAFTLCFGMVVLPMPPAASAAPLEAEGETLPTAQADVDALFGAIALSYAGTAVDWQGMDLAATGNAGAVDVDAVTANALDACSSPGTTDIQRSIIALTALGVDATSVPAADGTTVDLIALLASTPDAVNTPNGRFFALIAYGCGPYEIPADAVKGKQDLIDEILIAQLPDGGFSYASQTAESDMTAMAVAALASSTADDPAVEAACGKALAALHTLQLPDGGFSSAFDADPTVCNANSTAMAVIALCAVGTDPATQWVGANGVSPLGALLSHVNESQTGFLYAGADNALATEQGFRALVAVRGLMNTGAAYNVYLQAAQGEAGIGELVPAPAPEVPAVDSPSEEVQPETVAESASPAQGATVSSGGSAPKQSAAATSAKTTPATADDTTAFMVTCAAGAAAAVYVGSRRKRER